MVEVRSGEEMAMRLVSDAVALVGYRRALEMVMELREAAGQAAGAATPGLASGEEPRQSHPCPALS